MRLLRFITLVGIIFGSTTAAAAPRSDDRVDSMVRGLELSSGQTYLAARARLTNLSANDKSKLLRDLNRPGQSLDRRIALTIAVFVAERPRDVFPAELNGLRPDIYQARRRPEPNAERRMRNLPAAHLIELLTKTGAHYPALGQTESARALERTALLQGALRALSTKDHPLAFEVIRQTLETSRNVDVRYAAARSLGANGREAAVPGLVARVDAKSEVDAVKMAAIASLGEVRTAQSLLALKTIVRNAPATLRVSAVRAIGASASHAALKNGDYSAERAATLRRDVAQALVAQLVAAESTEVTNAVIEAMCVVKNQAVVERLDQARAADQDAPHVDRALRRVRRAIARLR